MLWLARQNSLTRLSRPAPFRDRWSAALLTTILQLCFVCSSVGQIGPMLQPETEKNYQPRPYQGKLESDDGQWIRPAKDYASTRYSSLDQINTGNAKDLKLAFTFSTGMTRGHEAAPLVVNNTMYIVTPFPNKLYALDATMGALKWSYTTAEHIVSSPAVANGVVYIGSWDDKLYAFHLPSTAA